MNIDRLRGHSTGFGEEFRLFWLLEGNVCGFMDLPDVVMEALEIA